MIEAIVQELLVILVLVNMMSVSAKGCSYVGYMVWCVVNLVAGPVILPCA